MSDLISRQDALDILDDFEADIELGKRDSYKAHREKLLSLPSAEPKTGKWYIREYEYFTCSECGEDYWNSCDSTAQAEELLETGDYPNFCPNCGCRMGEDNNE